MRRYSIQTLCKKIIEYEYDIRRLVQTEKRLAAEIAQAQGSLRRVKSAKLARIELRNKNRRKLDERAY